MIGPSAPNGPPVPIEMAEESGFRIATFGLDPAAADQDRLERLGDAVAADLRRAVARHRADDEAAGDRHRDAPERRGGSPAGETARGREAAEEGQVGDDRDQPDERLGDEGAHDADEQRRGREDQDARVGRIIAEAGVVGRLRHAAPSGRRGRSRGRRGAGRRGAGPRGRGSAPEPSGRGASDRTASVRRGRAGGPRRRAAARTRPGALAAVDQADGALVEDLEPFGELRRRSGASSRSSGRTAAAGTGRARSRPGARPPPRSGETFEARTGIGPADGSPPPWARGASGEPCDPENIVMRYDSQSRNISHRDGVRGGRRNP